MGRPRKVSDEEVFGAAMRAMSRLGPAELTLAAIAEEAGLTAGALVQRFGSKRDLLLTMSRLLGGGTSELFAQLREAHPSPLAAMRAYAEGMAHLARSPTELVRNFSYLQIDLSDPGFRKHLLVHARATRKELQALLQEAIKHGELTRGTNTATLARTIEATIGGALLTWACYREGTASAWLREHVDAVLAPHQTRGGRSRVK